MTEAVNLVEEQTTLPIMRDELLAVRRSMVVRSYGLTDVGKRRRQNEDQFLIAELTKALRVRQSSLAQPKTQYSDERGYLFIVADGMGGHQAGEQASALAVGTIEEFVLNTLKWFFHLRSDEEQNVLAEFQAALRQADEKIFEQATRHPELRGMGTTLTMAYSSDSQLFVVHVGDSRCYLHRNGQLYRLTHDHTLVEEMLRHHALTPEQAARHYLRHVITNCVGGDRLGLQVEVHRVELVPGDTILLCSDGLTEMLPDTRIGEVLAANPDPRVVCEALVEEANARGGRDNITVVVSRYSEPE
jgi:protein phosphatase